MRTSIPRKIMHVQGERGQEYGSNVRLKQV